MYMYVYINVEPFVVEQLFCSVSWSVVHEGVRHADSQGLGIVYVK